MIRVNPIYDWNYWEVWAYIRENNLPYNPLYDKGYRRIGCWCCPINGWTHYRRLKKTHPRLYGFLENLTEASTTARVQSTCPCASTSFKGGELKFFSKVQMDASDI